MPEGQNKKLTPKELREKELKDKISKKEVVDTKELITQIATRNILEGDYNQNLVDVVFESAPGVKRMLKAKRPTPKQMTEILKLNANAMLLGEIGDSKAAEKLTNIYKQLSEIAASLCEDGKLNADFWFNNVSNTTLQNFIGELMRATQQGPITEAELNKFR